jgi:hypothetical protein
VVVEYAHIKVWKATPLYRGRRSYSPFRKKKTTEKAIAKIATPHPVQHKSRCTTREAPPRINLVSDAHTWSLPAGPGPPPRIPPRVHVLTGFSTQRPYVHTCGGAHADVRATQRVATKAKEEREKAGLELGSWDLMDHQFSKANPS